MIKLTLEVHASLLNEWILLFVNELNSLFHMFCHYNLSIPTTTVAVKFLFMSTLTLRLINYQCHSRARKPAKTEVVPKKNLLIEHIHKRSAIPLSLKLRPDRFLEIKSCFIILSHFWCKRNLWRSRCHNNCNQLNGPQQKSFDCQLQMLNNSHIDSQQICGAPVILMKTFNAI